MASLSDKQRQLYEAEAEAKVDAAATQEAATAAGTAPAPHDALMGSFEQGTGPPPHRPRAHPDKESNPEAGRVQGHMDIISHHPMSRIQREWWAFFIYKIKYV